MKLDEHVPSLVVDLVAIARRVNDVQTKAHTVLNDDYIPQVM